jgi:N-acetylglucosamine malate deacetylase 1
MRILCIAPHADDETLGCGGTLLRHRAEGDDIHWLLVTEPKAPLFSADFMARRRAQVEAVRDAFGFSSLTRLELPAAGLDAISDGEMVGKMKTAIAAVSPDMVYVNHGGDAHSDHGAVFRATLAALKPFRTGKSVRSILAYETLSETEQAAPFPEFAFQPTSFVDIGDYLERKLEIMAIYAEELMAFPLPREPGAIRAQARLRGAAVATGYAEAFRLVRDVR